jgi:hypothetical protein
MATPQQQEYMHKEGRMALAIQAYKMGLVETLEAAAALFNVPPTTLR